MKRFLNIVVIVFFATFLLNAESISELQQRKNKAMKDLEVTSSLISKTKKTKENTLGRLHVLNAEISVRQNLIGIISTEVTGIEKQIVQLRGEAKQKQADLDDLKAEYATLMYHSYFKKNKYEKLMFVLSGKDFGESYRRYRYVLQYSEYCKKKGQEIEQVKIDLETKLEQIEDARLQKISVLNERKKESTKLQTEKQKQADLVVKLKKTEVQLKKDLKKHQQRANALNHKIEQMIADEARKEEEAKKVEAAREAKKVPSKNATNKNPRTYTPTMNKEEKLLSGGFEKNQGRLPWPTAKGVVIGHFGVQPHAVLKFVTTDNKGIYIQTTPGADARAVFEGEVTQRFAIPGSNNTVIVRHGIYRTVYSNLTSIYVKVGDKVSAKQSIGKIFVDNEDEDKTILYFQVWKERNTQNPENWLTR